MPAIPGVAAWLPGLIVAVALLIIGWLVALSAALLLAVLQNRYRAASLAMLAGVCDEESGASSELGMRHLLDAGIVNAQKVKGAIYTYAGSGVSVGTAVKVCPAHCVATTAV